MWNRTNWPEIQRIPPVKEEEIALKRREGLIVVDKRIIARTSITITISIAT